MINVTHDGHHRRTLHQGFLAALVFTELQIKAFQKLAVLIFGGHDLDLVVHFVAEQHQCLLRHGGCCGDHLAEVEQCLHQCSGVGTDLVGKVRQGRAASETQRRTAAVRQPNATDDVRCLHCLVLIPLLPLRLASLTRSAARTPESASCATTATTTATGTTATVETAARSTTGTARASATTTAASSCLGGHLPRIRVVCGHHSRGGTTPAALTLRTLGASSSLGAALTALVRTIALTLAATAALALLSSLVRAISTRSRTAAWARCRAVTATSGERVVGYPRRTSARLRSWLGHGARHSAAFRGGCGAITGTSSTSAECGRTRLRSATRSVTRTGFRGAGFSRTRLRAGLSRAWFRSRGSRRSGTACRARLARLSGAGFCCRTR